MKLFLRQKVNQYHYRSEVLRKLRFPDYVAQDGGKVVSLTYLPLLPKENLLVLISVRG